MTKAYLTSIEQAFALLSLFSSTCQDLSVSEASERLALPMSNTHRLLASLTHVGVLEQDPSNSRYSLTLKLWELGSHAFRHLDIREVARPFLKQLSQYASETVFLSVLDGSELLYLDRVDADQDLRVLSKIGSRQPPYCTSSGLAILAFSPTAIVNGVIAKGLESFTSRTKTTPDGLRAELARIRALGYATNVEGRALGISGVAAPILNPETHAIAAVSISGPSARLTEDRFCDLGERARQTAQQISAARGYAAR